MSVVALFGAAFAAILLVLLCNKLRMMDWQQVVIFRTPRNIHKVVRYPNLTKTVNVRQLKLDVPNVPVFSKFCEELPVWREK